MRRPTENGDERPVAIRRHGAGDGTPYLSVIVPVHNAAAMLPQSLDALAASTLPRARWELIVVDDASSDGSVLVAAQHADLLVRLPEARRGAAYARNRGADVASGEVLVFIDADVRVRPETLSRIAGLFESQDDLAAVYGAYDAVPRRGSAFADEYRNLLRQLVHGGAAGRSNAFWAACGAMRREAFDAAGRFDEWSFRHPQLEDAELGGRLAARGYRTELVPELQVSHLKRWTLGELLVRDAWDRGVLRGRIFAGSSAGLDPTVTLRLSRVPTEALAAAALASAAAGAWMGETILALLGGVLLAIFVIAHGPLIVAMAATRGALFAIRALPLHLLREATTGFAMMHGRLLRALVGAPRPDPTTEAYAEVGLETWPPVPTRP